ncbi:phosphatase PAP2 family protein [Patescibacteria group bacterium]|nr:phosphatase PAP2 family protein [Patescibacteria group bacterium]
MKQPGILFWQSRTNYLKILSAPFNGNLLLFLNYAIWFFLFFIAFLLVKKDGNIFWQLLLITSSAEVVERFLKRYNFWQRPLYQKTKKTPRGLVESWYNTGSFPSGHTTKLTYFFLFALQYHIINPFLYLAVSLPLIFFRVLVGFHYPVDILAGLVIGSSLWFLFHGIIFPAPAVSLVNSLFNFIF